MVVRKVGSASHLPLQNRQLMSKYCILRLKPALRLGASGPHDFAVRDLHRSSACRKTAHKPDKDPPHVRDDREPPLWERDGRIYRGDFSNSESGIFFESGLDTDLLICPTGCLRAGSVASKGPALVGN